MRSTFAVTVRNQLNTGKINMDMGKTTTNNLLSPVISESDVKDLSLYTGTNGYFNALNNTATDDKVKTKYNSAARG